MGAAGVGAGAAVASAAVGAGTSIAGASKAASGQQAAATTNQQALATEQAMAQPYATIGQTAESGLINLLNTSGGAIDPTLGPLGAPAPENLSDIANMPGYQFTLNQGLLSTQNAAAARGLGVSGAALMGAANYATGAAQSNFQNYFNDYWANQNNRYNMLSQLTGVGASAAVGAGSNVANTAGNIGANQAAGAGIQGSGIAGAGNSLTSLASNPYVMNALMNPSNTGATINPNSGAAAGYASELPSGGFLGGSY